MKYKKVFYELYSSKFFNENEEKIFMLISKVPCEIYTLYTM